MSNKKPNNKGFGIVALIGMTLGCLFLLGFGIFALTVAGEPVIAYLCGGIGLLGVIGSIALWIVLIHQNKQGVTLESKQQWPTGVLTDEVIKKDLYVHDKTMIVSWFVLTGMLAFWAILTVCVGEEMIPVTLLFGAVSLVTLFLGLKTIIARNGNMKYRIETDKVLGVETKVEMDEVQIRTYSLQLEKHGEYEIDSTRIHAYHTPGSLAKCIEPGEELYMVYSVKTNKVLYIYRKKYWKRNKD